MLVESCGGASDGARDARDQSRFTLDGKVIAGGFNVVQPRTRVTLPGHNGGPALEPDDPNEGWQLYCWRRARKAAGKTPPREIALRRLARAEALEMTYRDYTLEIMERGRYL